MRPITERFSKAVRTSHRLATEARILTTGGDEIVVPIDDGSVTLDQTAAVRGRCDLSLVLDPAFDLLPRAATDPIAPYGNEIQVSRGVKHPDGTTELVSLGVFRIQVAAPSDTTVRVTGLDRAQRIIDARFEEPYNVAAGTNYATAILDCVRAAWPDVPHALTGTALTTPALIAQEGDDRWQFAQDMATAIAMRLYFDGDGTLTLVPDLVQPAVDTIAEGTNGVLVAADREWTRDGAYNAVIATGENTTEAAPARGVAIDNNTNSPTYYYGPFGRVPRFYSSSFLTTDAQAAAAAASLLQRELGTTEKVSFGSFVLPHLEPGDTVRVTRARTGIDEDHILDSLVIPLSAGATMTGQTRARQIT